MNGREVHELTSRSDVTRAGLVQGRRGMADFDWHFGRNVEENVEKG